MEVIPLPWVAFLMLPSRGKRPGSSHQPSTRGGWLWSSLTGEGSALLSADGALIGNKKQEVLCRERLALWQHCLESVRKRTRTLVGVSLQCQL